MLGEVTPGSVQKARIPQAIYGNFNTQSVIDILWLWSYCYGNVVCVVFLLLTGEIIIDAMSKGSVCNFRKLSALLVDGLLSIGQQQNVRMEYSFQIHCHMVLSVLFSHSCYVSPLCRTQI